MKTLNFISLVLSFVFIIISNSIATNPNIVLILSDDQDTVLGSMKPMKKTRELLTKQGTSFENAFATTPICCPSRASILTGLYLHNHKTVNNSINGGCNSEKWKNIYEPYTFSNKLKNHGYTTFYAGKYLNTYGHNDDLHVPIGWDWWIGLIGNSKYYNYTLSVNGSAVHHKDDYQNDYLTDVVKRRALDFLNQKFVKPFLMVLSTPAPHEPFTPAPQYLGKYSGYKTPRFPNFNFQSKDKHWFMKMPPNHLSNNTIKLLDEIYARRLETILSVDDLVSDIINKLETMNILNNTYIIYTSDHGFHIGQYALAWDKRTPYESDTRIPFIIRGPNIEKNKISSVPILNIDIAPTILNMANINYDKTSMDGKSILLKQNNSRTFLIEYRGEGNENSNSKYCPSYNDNTLSECRIEAECKCQDSKNNTYNCFHQISYENDILYCEFQDNESYKELYNMKDDVYQLNNLFPKINNNLRQNLHKVLKELSVCNGLSCTQDYSIFMGESKSKTTNNL